MHNHQFEIDAIHTSNLKIAHTFSPRFHTFLKGWQKRTTYLVPWHSMVPNENNPFQRNHLGTSNAF